MPAIERFNVDTSIDPRSMSGHFGSGPGDESLVLGVLASMAIEIDRQSPSSPQAHAVLSVPPDDPVENQAHVSTDLNMHLTDGPCCLQTQALRDLANGSCDDEASVMLFEHLDHCESCRQRLTDIESEIQRTADGTSGLLQGLRNIANDGDTPHPSNPYALESEMQHSINDAAGLLHRMHGVGESTSACQVGEATKNGSTDLFGDGDTQEDLCETLPGHLPQRIRDYELIEQIGAGGMGAVYEARHVRLGRTVAIKLIHRGTVDEQEGGESQANAASLGRFQREMAAVGQMNHPHIVSALDAGEENGQCYLVMERLHGNTLAQHIAEHGVPDLPVAIAIIRQTLSGLQHIHQSGMIHRDLKPSNVMLTDCSPSDSRQNGSGRQASGSTDGHNQAVCVKLLDLGIAMQRDRLPIDVNEKEQNSSATDSGNGASIFLASRACSGAR
ncbi:MAG: serine/threonine-protein kinase [Planctomycetota bacterium]